VRQGVYLGAGLVAMLAISRFDYSRLRELKWGLYVMLILAILVVLGVGHSINGSTRSIGISLFSFQGSELAKVLLIVFLAAFVLLAASIAGKLLGVRIAGSILGWKRGEYAIIGWLLQTKALIMIIFANILLDKAIITSETFTALLLMAVASTMLTVPVVAPKLEGLRDLTRKSGHADLT